MNIELTPEQHIKALGIIHGSGGYFFHILEGDPDGSAIFMMGRDVVAIHGQANNDQPSTVTFTLICGDQPAEVFKRKGLMDPETKPENSRD